VEVARSKDDEALRAIEEAMALWSKQEERAEKIASARYLSVGLLLRMFDPKDSLVEASQVRAFFAEEGDKCREAMALVAVATIAYARGGLDEAVDSLALAKELFEAASDPRGQCLALSTLAEMYRGYQRYQEAREVSLLYKAQAQEAGFKDEEIKALIALSGLHRQMEDLKAGGRAAREGLRLARHGGQQEQQVQTLLQCIQSSLTAVSYGASRPSRNLIEETTRLSKDAVRLTSSQDKLPAAGWKRQQHGVALYWHASALALSSRAEALAVIDQIELVCDATGDEELRAYAQLLSAQIHMDTDKAKAAALLQPVIASFKRLKDATGTKFAEEVFQKATFVAPSPRAVAEPGGELQPIAAAPAPPSKLSESSVKALVLEVARGAVTSEGDVGQDDALMDMGMDSLTSVQFRTDLQEKFGVADLPASLIFEYPSVSALTQMILDKLS